MPIRDQHKYKKLEVELRQLRTIRYFRPFLWLFGKKGREASVAIGKSLKQMPELEDQLERLRETPDGFNAHFRERGWIASDDMNLDAMVRAVEIAESEGVEKGEAYLLEYYGIEELGRWLKIFCFIPFMEPRKDLLMAAFEDHKAGRYHASVPVVLAQVDGITHDLVNQTFYRRGRKRTLQATETIVGDPEGLAALSDLVSVSRSSTTGDQIGIPYRHGILHGRDLGYANRLVSTKSFALLIALRPWVLQVLNDKQFYEPPIDYIDPSTATWDDVKDEWAELVKALEALDETRRRRDQDK